ncbi:MAG: cytochrome c oxidase subunit 3 [Myxococcota bacterium]
MATEQLTDAEAHGGEGAESLGVTNGKLGMWTFLVMDAMTFAGFLAGYARLRWAPESGWPNPYETFGLVGIQLTAFNTFVLICSSVSMVHVLSETIKGNLGRARKWMMATIIGGLIFLGIQGFEWSHLIVDKWPYIFGGEAVDYNMNFAATFLSLTGFHGLHVSVGVMYNIIIYLGLRRGKINETNSSLVEIAGLYWHFVDLIWILVFTFVYLV